MINLAGNRDADRHVERELIVAGLESQIVRSPDLVPGEVPTTLSAKYGGFTFERAWRYWSVKGKVPVLVAWDLYHDPCGKTDIRVAGHCGCPPPEHPWIDYFDEQGDSIHSLADKAEFEEAAKKDNVLGEIAKEALTKLKFSDCKAYGFITTYHIDSEVGLRVFVDTLRRSVF